MSTEKKHWTADSNGNFQFAVASQFVDQVEDRLDEKKMTQADLAEALKVTPGRVSQFMNDPGHLKLSTMVQVARSLGMKFSIVVYDDGEEAGARGPIEPSVFFECWKALAMPLDNWELKALFTKTESPKTKGHFTKVIPIREEKNNVVQPHFWNTSGQADQPIVAVAL